MLGYHCASAKSSPALSKSLLRASETVSCSPYSYQYGKYQRKLGQPDLSFWVPQSALVVSSIWRIETSTKYSPINTALTEFSRRQYCSMIAVSTACSRSFASSAHSSV
jgi:hypothetical protein